ncbi:MAG: CRISPR-associated protein Csy2 [Colwellia sp.]|jgi:CRISPR-associated protein Csy2|tara:strand:- start:2930 stop:5032 length:2103 start_codon:yes stop_codon:yes gene_type:complete
MGMHLQELLAIESVPDRDQSLRRAFSAYTEEIDITGYESIALTILLNLTYRKVQIDNLLDKKLAKKALNNESLLNKCIDELQWFHTHNLKYPDIRVSKQNLVVDSPMLHPLVLSSANYDRAYGWTHNSAQVNLVKLFVSYFYWQGNKCCLAEILAAQPIEVEWKAAFQSLGMQVKLFINICGRVKGFLPQVMIPDTVDRYSPQVRMPYHDGYVAVTPVVSHVLQSKIQQAAINKNGKFSQIEFTRSAAVSQLVASLGGVVKALSYPLYFNNKHHGLHDSRRLKVQNGQSVFNLIALTTTHFINALNGLIYNGNALALKQRRQQKVICIKAVRNALSEWLSPIFEWRFSIIENKSQLEQLDKISDTLEYQLLTTLDDDLPELVNPLFGVLNAMFSHDTSTQKYAFHPKLIGSIKASLKWLLSNAAIIDNSPAFHDNEEQYRYLHLRDIRVFDAQALSNPYCAGTPSLTAAWGMMHHYQRKLNNALDTNVRFTSFSWFIKDYSNVPGKKLPEMRLQGAKQNELKRPGIIDNKHCDLVFDLVIHIDGNEEDLLLIDEQPEMLKAHFPTTFAGGVMHPPELDLAINWCRLYDDENKLFEKLKRLPLSGRWVMPTKHKICDLDELLLLLNNDLKLSPIMFGYLLLDKPKKRCGSLEELHCYAEPAIGLVEYITAINIRLKGKNFYFNHGFWMLEAKEQFMLMKGV